MKSIKSLLSVAALAISGIAAAGSPDSQSVVVRYGDLNLNSQAGVKSLHKRIRNAAESVCSELSSSVLSLRSTYEQCIDQAVADGVSAVANPNLSNFHRSKGKSAVLASN
ncbi:MAG TPA: UrcA family protein [Steroidobacteraceae bacterium]|jgi:UrcA family protein|nr:UrcA family protein [Steroidobacteraceae bacterium]